MILARRRALSLGFATSVAGLAPLKALASLRPSPTFRGPLEGASPAASAPRRAYLHNLHTGETLDQVYFEAGGYVPGALSAAMRVLRDWRDGEEHVMDPRLFDLLHVLRTRTEASAPFQIISGYRSPATNARMHAESHEVAAKSQHMYGKALDIRVAGIDLDHLHKAALSLNAGGVGYYPQSDFVHVDVGPVRRWSGT